jgi:hypothetical protein
MRTLPVTFPSGAAGYASMEDVAAAVRCLLIDEVADRSNGNGRDGACRTGLNADYDRAIIQTIVDRAAERGIVAH